MIRAALALGLALLCGQGTHAQAPQQEPPQAPILRVEAAAHTAPVSRLATDAAGRILASVSDDKTLRLWSLPDGTPLGVLRPPIGEREEGELYAVALSPDGSRVFAGGSTGRSWDGSFSIYVFDTASGRILARLPGQPAPIQDLAMSPDGTRLAAALGGRAGIRMWDTANGRLVAEDAAGWQGTARMVGFSRDGRLAATASDGRLRVYDRAGRRTAERQLQANSRLYGVSWSPDGALLAVGFEDRLRVEVVMATDLRTVMTPDVGGLQGEGLPAVAWAHDGRGGLQLLAAGYGRVAQATPQAGGGTFNFVIRRWGDFGMGPARDVAASRDAIAHLLPLPAGGRELTVAALGADGKQVAGTGSVLLALPERSAPQVAPLAVLVPQLGPARMLGAPATAPGTRLGLDTVDYDEQGSLRFSGTAPPNAPVRVYVDNKPAGDAVADARGQWALTPLGVVAGGVHRLRVDQLGLGGKVASRVELPFERSVLPAAQLAGGRVVVQPGENLWRLARGAYGDGSRYRVIYLANKEQIRDPKLIYPGQAFALPSP